MKKFLQNILLVTILYLILVFFNVEFNPLHWNVIAKLLFLFIGWAIFITK